MPCILSWPGRIQTGVQRDALVELTDLAPTLLEAAGLPVPERMQGQSLWPLLQDSATADQHRAFVRSEYYRALNPDYSDRFNGTYGTMIRDTRYKLVVYHGHEIGELYDLNADPGEFENRWADPDLLDVKLRLIRQSFDALALSVDVGPAQVLRF